MSGVKQKLTVLVTEGENRSSLAVTRSLGRHGCRVIVTGERIKNLASCSRYCDARYAVPSPLRDGQSYLASIQSIIIGQAVDVLFPMTEPAVLLLAQNKEKFPTTMILASPELEKVQKVFDKYRVFRLAEELGVAMPQTLFMDNRKDFAHKKQEIQKFPVVVKPALSKIPIKDGFLAAGVRYVNDIGELERLYKAEEALDFPSMIQEKIIGPGTGLFTLFEHNRHLALFSHQRVLEKPPAGGVSVVSESVSLDSEMVETSRELLAAADWQGVAMVEFKRDQRDGRAKLMEINGRFWGSLQLAITCGVDFPVLYLDYLQGKSVLPSKDYKLGYKLKWFFGTLDHLIIRFKNNSIALNLPDHVPSKGEALISLLKLWEKNASYDVFDCADIYPSLCEISSYFREMSGRE